MAHKKEKEGVKAGEGKEYGKPELTEYEDLRSLTGMPRELTNGNFID